MSLSYCNRFLCLSSLMISAWAGEYRMDEKKRLEAPISLTDVTRIYVEGDRIQQVIGLDGHYALETDDTSGQIFIKPIHTSHTSPLNVSLMTEGGLTQDLTLKPQAGAGEALCLRSQGVHKKSRDLLGRRHSMKATGYVGELLTKIRYAMDPSVMSEDQALEPESQIKDVLTLKPLKRWQDETYEITLYKLTNVSPNLQTIEQKEIARPHDVALALGCPKLKPHDATSLVRIALRTS